MKRLFVFLPLLIVLTACGGSQTTNSTPIAQPTPTVAPPHFYNVGETVTAGKTWKVTVNSANISKGTEYLVPSDAGDVFLLIDVTLNNTSQVEQEPDGTLWTLRGLDGTKYSTIMSSSPPSGKVEAGMPVKGTLGYEVPGTVHEFRLAFDNDVQASGQTIWQINV